jgi:signal transduction histidine kinase
VTALNRLLGSTPFQLALIYLCAFVPVAALIVGFIAWRANNLLTTKVVETLLVEVTTLREQYQIGGATRLATIINERTAEPGAGLYLLVDVAGRKVAGNLRQVPRQLQAANSNGVFRYVPTAGGQEREGVGVLLDVPNGLMLIVGRDTEDLRSFARSMGELGLIGLLLLSAFGIAAGLIAGRTVLRRIETVTDTTREIMAGNFSRRIPLSGSGDEFDRLGASLNAMLERIELLMAALREVSDNIAHDLKTPLNRLRSRAEAALRNPDGPVSYRDGLVKTIEEADELIKTFNSLLLIARLEAGAVAESMVPLDPAAIIADVAELYEPAAEEAGLALETTAEKGLRLVANRELVSQAIANLVDNAIKYSVPEPQAAPREPPVRPTITIALSRAGAGIEIAVGDRGPGVAPQDRARALQRFGRLEKSRTRPGSGLGLSLVAAVARLHGGTFRLEDNNPGLLAVLAFPLPAAGGAVPIVPAARTEAPST